MNKINNEKAIKTFSSESFDDFENKSFLIRNIDSQGNVIVFVSVDLKNSYHNGPYIITFQDKQGNIKSTSTKLMQDSTKLDKTKVNRLAIKFLQYNIYGLSVDEHKNVFIRLQESETPQLIKFSDIKYKTEQYKGWKLIKDDWYEVSK